MQSPIKHEQVWRYICQLADEGLNIFHLDNSIRVQFALKQRTERFASCGIRIGDEYVNHKSLACSLRQARPDGICLWRSIYLAGWTGGFYLLYDLLHNFLFNRHFYGL